MVFVVVKVVDNVDVPDVVDDEEVKALPLKFAAVKVFDDGLYERFAEA